MASAETALDKMLREIAANNERLEGKFRANAAREEFERAKVNRVRPIPAYAPRKGARLVKRTVPASRPQTPAMMAVGLTPDIRAMIAVPDAKEVAATVRAAGDPAFMTFFDMRNYLGRLHDEKVYATVETALDKPTPQLASLDSTSAEVYRVDAMLREMDAWIERFKKRAALDPIKLSRARVRDRAAHEIECERTLRRVKRVLGNAVNIFVEAIQSKKDLTLALTNYEKYLVMHCLDGSPFKGDEHSTRAIDLMRSVLSPDGLLMHDVIKIQAKVIAHVLEGTKVIADAMRVVSVLQAESVFQDSWVPTA